MSLWQQAPAGLILFPLLAAPLALLFGRRTLPWLLLLTIALIALALLGTTGWIWENGPQRYAVGGWGAPLGIDLYADGLNLLLLWLTWVVSAPMCLYAFAYFRHHQNEYFWPLYLLLWTALNALFLAADIFNLYVTLELLTLAAISLVTLAGGQTALAAAMGYLLFAMLGSFFYLLGVALLYGGYGTLDMIQLSQFLTPGPLPWLAGVLMTLGLLVKMAAFPFHVWLPPAHASAPAPVSALLSALVVKAAFYLLLRLWFDVFAGIVTPGASQLMGVLGALAILYGSFQALRQIRLKLLVAYSTVAQLGYLLLVFPLAGAAAWNGAVLHAFSHGLAKTALFLAAGNVLYVLGHDRIGQLSESGHSLRLTFFAFGLAGIAIMGLPPSGNFLAKWLLLEASLGSQQWWWTVVILVGGLLAAVYVFRVLGVAFIPTSKAPNQTTLPVIMEIVPLVLAFAGLVLGFLGTPFLEISKIGSPFAGGQP